MEPSSDQEEIKVVAQAKELAAPTIKPSGLNVSNKQLPIDTSHMTAD
jgi:hypothetical protein